MRFGFDRAPAPPASPWSLLDDDDDDDDDALLLEEEEEEEEEEEDEEEDAAEAFTTSLSLSLSMRQITFPSHFIMAISSRAFRSFSRRCSSYIST